MHKARTPSSAAVGATPENRWGREERLPPRIQRHSPELEMPIDVPFPGVSAVVLAAKMLRTAGRKARGKPSAAERDALVEYVGTLDNRRVLYVPFGGEVVECCLGSLSSLLEHTEKTLVKLKHADARMVLEAMQALTRAFLDKWRGFNTRDLSDDWPRRAPREPWHMRGEAQAQFFLDLGDLRRNLIEMVELLRVLESEVKAPNLLGA